MANPRRTTTRRAVLSYDRLKQLTAESGAPWVNLLIKDYQGIIQDANFIADEVDAIDNRVIDLEDSHYPNIATQVQFLQQQIDGLPEFTMDTEGFTMDTTDFTMDKVIA